jgi:hypothetical protein
MVTYFGLHDRDLGNADGGLKAAEAAAHDEETRSAMGATRRQDVFKKSKLDRWKNNKIQILEFEPRCFSFVITI